MVGEIKSGKEGTVYCCRAHPSTGFDLLAAKVYRPRSQRSFRNDAIYREGRMILNKRDARAARKNTGWGQGVRFGTWINHEYETLTALSSVGADVPIPMRRAQSAILMTFVGDEAGAASALQAVSLELDEARALFRRVYGNIELLLRENVIHGDLSAYNILYWQGSVTIIDFPQAVDPRSNQNALALLSRDIENVCEYFARYGVRTDPARMTHHLWGRFVRSEL